MNYRHIYHAGNFADVFKHIILLQVLTHLKKKDKGFFVLDTHGGIGLYDLASEQAGKTGEYKAGIEKVLEAPAPPESLKDYLDFISSLNRDGQFTIYPGSPYLSAMHLRPQDRLTACELHPDDAAQLAQVLHRFANVKTEHRNGYEALKALLPPAERRGCVLIDPPFEDKQEFQTIVKAMRAALKRWPTGTYMIWYPIKNPQDIAAFHANLRAENLPEHIAADFYIKAPDDPTRLNGCGMFVINPPWGLQELLTKDIMPFLRDVLAQPA